MTRVEPMAAPMAAIDLEDLALGEGGHLLLARGLATSRVIAVRGRDPALAVDLPAWCRSLGHALADLQRGAIVTATITRTTADRWVGAERAGAADPRATDAIASTPPARWGLAARGALVEAGAPAFDFPLADRDLVWTDDAARLYAAAAAAQWDPAIAIPWDESTAREARGGGSAPPEGTGRSPRNRPGR